MSAFRNLLIAAIMATATPIAGSHASTPAQVDSDIAAGRWGNAIAGMKAIPETEKIRILAKYATRNYTQAQWQLGVHYMSKGQLQAGAQWLFIARLGTRLDSTVCSNSDALGADVKMAYAYRNLFQAINARQDILKDALLVSFKWHLDRMHLYARPEWTCAYWNSTMGIENTPENLQTRNANGFRAARKSVYDDLLRQSRLEYRIRPQKKTAATQQGSGDPMQENFSTNRLIKSE